MRPYLLLALIVAGLVGACTSTPPTSQDQLARGCQIRKCVCLKPRESFLPALTKRQDAELQWRTDGTAFCPDGFQLELRDKPGMYDRAIY
jgi:hypothetical protein